VVRTEPLEWQHMMPDWLLDEITIGLQKLLSLRLPGSPAEDTAGSTARVWYEAIGGSGIEWTETLDRLRVRAAFRGLATRCDRWPAPKHFFEQLQARGYAQPQLQQKFSDDELRLNKARIRKIVEQFKQQHTIGEATWQGKK